MTENKKENKPAAVRVSLTIPSKAIWLINKHRNLKKSKELLTGTGDPEASTKQVKNWKNDLLNSRLSGAYYDLASAGTKVSGAVESSKENAIQKIIEHNAEVIFDAVLALTETETKGGEK